jgi:allantoicase
MSAFTDRFDLASLRLGASVLYATDDFFAEKENLLLPHDAEWREHAYSDRGKWMDGWESRRKRHPDGTANTSLHPDFHDFCVVRLGLPGVIRGVCVDTSWFRGNFPEACEIFGCAAPIDAPLDVVLASPWTPVLGKTALEGNSKNLFPVECAFAFTHLKLVIYPDGGVARLRVYGDVVPDWRRIGHARGEIDLAAAESGGDVIACSDMFFGERRNLIMPGRAKNMSDGWETRRRRGQGHDWAIVRLATRGEIGRLEIDTNHFKGNFPDTCSVEACSAPASADTAQLQAAAWRELLARTPLMAHTRHYFEDELTRLGPVSHVRLSVYPDGGVSRLRVFGTIDAAARTGLGVTRLDTLPVDRARAELLACCASERWVSAMLAARPFGSAAAVYAACDAAWASTGPKDWHEAFAAHPRIGERAAGEPKAGAGWSAQEQAGMSAAQGETRRRMAEVNQAYEERFGFTYIVCATGKSADELLAIAEARLANTPEREIAIAGEALHEITKIRLGKVLQP